MGKLWIWLLIAARFQDSNCQENELPSCPTPCDCKWKSGKPTINCRDKNLTYVPHYQPVDDEKLYKVLVMDNNDILLTADPQFSAVGYDEVQTLTMKNCSLIDIQPLTFHGLHNLRELVLSNNLLTMLIQHQFTDLPKLRSLDLSNNIISSVNEESFSMIGSHLERIDLSNNKLFTMSVSVLEPLVSLKHLLLFKNPWNCFCELGELNSFLHEKNVKTEDVECSKPNVLKNQNWRELHLSEFTCPPIIQLSVMDADASDSASNQTVLLRCEVKGNPLPQILWKLNGKILAGFDNELHQQQVEELITKESYYKRRVANLKLSRKDKSFTSTKCLASNSIGDVEKSYSAVSTGDAFSQVDDSSNSALAILLLTAGGSLIFIIIIIVTFCCWRTKKKQFLDSDENCGIKNLSISLISKTYQSEVSDNNGDSTYMRGKDPCEDLKECARANPPLNTAGCRSSISSNNSSFANFYGSLRRPYYSQYASSSDCQVVHYSRGPGYVTLPRQPQHNVAPVTSAQGKDWLGSRTSADGCSQSNIVLSPYVSSNEPILTQSISLPPHSCPYSTMTPINTVGLPSSTSTAVRGEAAVGVIINGSCEIGGSIYSSTPLVSIQEQI